jgi:hypothetical protein
VDRKEDLLSIKRGKRSACGWKRGSSVYYKRESICLWIKERIACVFEKGKGQPVDGREDHLCIRRGKRSACGWKRGLPVYLKREKTCCGWNRGSPV